MLFLWSAGASTQSPVLPKGPDAAPAELLGRCVTQNAVAATYDFKSDGTFSITVGDKVTETGAWAANASSVPKIASTSSNARPSKPVNARQRM
jgi:hypothetical protein